MLSVELLDIDLDGEIVLGEARGAGDRYADSKASRSGPFDSVGSTGRLIRR